MIPEEQQEQQQNQTRQQPLVAPSNSGVQQSSDMFEMKRMQRRRLQSARIRKENIRKDSSGVKPNVAEFMRTSAKEMLEKQTKQNRALGFTGLLNEETSDEDEAGELEVNNDEGRNYATMTAAGAN